MSICKDFTEVIAVVRESWASWDPYHQRLDPCNVFFFLSFGWSFWFSTTSTAQGGGGSFKNRKPIGEIGCCESRMAERSHWWIERWLMPPLFLSLLLSFSDYLPTYLPIDPSIYLSFFLSIYPSVRPSIHPSIHLFYLILSYSILFYLILSYSI